MNLAVDAKRVAQGKEAVINQEAVASEKDATEKIRAALQQQQNKTEELKGTLAGSVEAYKNQAGAISTVVDAVVNYAKAESQTIETNRGYESAIKDQDKVIRGVAGALGVAGVAHNTFSTPVKTKHVPATEDLKNAHEDGLRPAERAVFLTLSSAMTVDLTLGMEKEEQVVVSGVAPLIDTTSTATGTNYTSDVINRLPVGRNYGDIVRSNPGVSFDFGDTQGRFLALSIYGATSAENQWVIDGVSTTNVFKGIQGKAINNEFVQEVEVKTGGYQAEYGLALGGVINVITKSGGNTFHGEEFVYYDSTSTTAERQFKAEDSQLADMKVDDAKRFDYGAALGGYFVKDRLWFFEAYNRVSLDGEVSVWQPTSSSRRMTGSHLTAWTTSTPESSPGMLRLRRQSSERFSPTPPRPRARRLPIPGRAFPSSCIRLSALSRPPGIRRAIRGARTTAFVSRNSSGRRPSRRSRGLTTGIRTAWARLTGFGIPIRRGREVRRRNRALHRWNPTRFPAAMAWFRPSTTGMFRRGRSMRRAAASTQETTS